MKQSESVYKKHNWDTRRWRIVTQHQRTPLVFGGFWMRAAPHLSSHSFIWRGSNQIEKDAPIILKVGKLSPYIWYRPSRTFILQIFQKYNCNYDMDSYGLVSFCLGYNFFRNNVYTKVRASLYIIWSKFRWSQWREDKKVVLLLKKSPEAFVITKRKACMWGGKVLIHQRTGKKLNWKRVRKIRCFRTSTKFPSFRNTIRSKQQYNVPNYYSFEWKKNEIA